MDVYRQEIWSNGVEFKVVRILVKEIVVAEQMITFAEAIAKQKINPEIKLLMKEW